MTAHEPSDQEATHAALARTTAGRAKHPAHVASTPSNKPGARSGCKASAVCDAWVVPSAMEAYSHGYCASESRSTTRPVPRRASLVSACTSEHGAADVETYATVSYTPVSASSIVARRVPWTSASAASPGADTTATFPAVHAAAAAARHIDRPRKPHASVRIASYPDAPSAALRRRTRPGAMSHLALLLKSARYLYASKRAIKTMRWRGAAILCAVLAVPGVAAAGGSCALSGSGVVSCAMTGIAAGQLVSVGTCNVDGKPSVSGVTPSCVNDTRVTVYRPVADAAGTTVVELEMTLPQAWVDSTTTAALDLDIAEATGVPTEDIDFTNVYSLRNQTAVVALNDDGPFNSTCGLCSFMQFTAPDDGTYTLRVSCFDSRRGCSGTAAWSAGDAPVAAQYQPAAVPASCLTSTVADMDIIYTNQVASAYSGTNRTNLVNSIASLTGLSPARIQVTNVVTTGASRRRLLTDGAESYYVQLQVDARKSGLKKPEELCKKASQSDMVLQCRVVS